MLKKDGGTYPLRILDRAFAHEDDDRPDEDLDGGDEVDDVPSRSDFLVLAIGPGNEEGVDVLLHVSGNVQAEDGERDYREQDQNQTPVEPLHPAGQTRETTVDEAVEDVEQCDLADEGEEHAEYGDDGEASGHSDLHL